MIEFDWMELFDRVVYFDTATSKIWATIDKEIMTMTTTIYRVGYDHQFLTLDGAKNFVQNWFSRYGNVISKE